jgi:hypothetical protein
VTDATTRVAHLCLASSLALSFGTHGLAAHAICRHDAVNNSGNDEGLIERNMTANADAMSVENDLLTAQAPSIGAEPWRTRYEAGKRVDFLQPLHKFFFNLIRARVHRSGCRNSIRSHVQ